ncbi:hypothetical protein FACS189429_6470 [Bacteroidia bacterium]|nr:hypothetical protein FACS189429_6470 [Bacteroidia bacterium]GHV45023.1 hypothetical protein FACS1894180_7090 [Bacteroidia bacterium]
MKYYKIDRIVIDMTYHKGISNANGEFVPNGEEYFNRIGNGEIIQNASVFDYFHLQSFGDKEDWEWHLQDIHGGGWVYPRGADWYISDKCKKLLEQFFIAPKYHFYETRLLYKGEKLVYWIFQFPIEPFQNIDFQKSDFILKDDNNIYHFDSEEEYLTFYRREHRETKRKLLCTKLCIKQRYDILYSPRNEKIVSERLKTAIEENGIEGFEFLEIEYEVVIND